MRTSTYIFLILLTFLTFCEQAPPEATADFQVTIENLTGTEVAPAAMLGSGVLYRQSFGSPMFFNRSPDYGDGLEQLAEDGNSGPLVLNLGFREEILEFDSFDNIMPGGSVAFSFRAEYGNRLNFATMFMQSNDLFYSFNDEGISLFEPSGDPINGDFTSKVHLWDIGSEENEPPYLGDFQPPRQAEPGEGVFTPAEVVRPRDDSFEYPSVSAVIRITVTSQSL
ncbi:MAG: spondin domain-containing protein [Bacteroidota bacterium]